MEENILWMLFKPLLLVFLFATILSILYGLWAIFKARIKGVIGEKVTSMILSRLDKKRYHILHDVLIEVNGRTSQIDHVIVSDYGIFVIETKNYKGWIFGDDDQYYWTQVIDKRKEKMYNPVKQNAGHVYALKQLLREFSDVPMIPIVVFSTRADLKINTEHEVVYSVNLLKTIKKYDRVVLTEQKKENIYATIVAHRIEDKKKRKQHVANIQRNLKKSTTTRQGRPCPRCGNRLIRREGKHGPFIGCSRFPRCRYTADV